MTKELFFEGKSYPATELLVDGENRIISTDSLYEKLMNDDCEPVSDRADEIEKLVFFFVPDHCITLDDKALARYVAWQQPEYNIQACR